MYADGKLCLIFRCKAKALSAIQLQLKMRLDLTLNQTDTRVHDLAALSLM